MKNKTTNPNAIWKAIGILGVMFSVIGAATVIYFGYMGFSSATSQQPALGQYNNSYGNGNMPNGTVPTSGLNQPNRNNTAFSPSLAGRNSLSLDMSELFSGVLMILLGLMIFKYAQLRISVSKS